MTSKELRDTFLGFFGDSGHKLVEAASLIPGDDPTLLFTGAGMNQFKHLFIDSSHSDFKRAATSQPCLRVTDIENIGKTARHLTYIEMLGNFSFGDYFKEKAISYAWEFLTEKLNLPKERLWATVFKDDEETAQIWNKKIGIPPERIVSLGEEHNFWDMGKTGPCGPCSELIIDMGKDTGCGRPDCRPGCDCDRYLELWNLVFTEFNRQPDGRLEPLKQKNIDTGMGLERIAAVSQGAGSVFETDLIKPVVEQVGTLYFDNNTAHIIADHIRAAVFCILEGIYPDNTGRGYVVRRLIRRAAEIGNLAKIGNSLEDKPLLHKLIPSIKTADKTRAELLNSKRGEIERVIKAEEEKFFAVFEKLPQLEEEIKNLKKSGEDTLPGELYFKYYDTYGIPRETIRIRTISYGLKVDEAGFERAISAQRGLARMTSGFDAPQQFIKDFAGKTHFTGYNKLEEGRAEVLALRRDGVSVESAEAPAVLELILDKTPFYGEKGGQVGDAGEIRAEGFDARVRDTKCRQGSIIHYVSVDGGQIKKSDMVELFVNEERRKAICRNHTATHLLQSALRKLVSKNISQAGSFVGPDGLRFDFKHFNKIPQGDIRVIEKTVNEWIRENIPLEILEDIPLKEAREMGAIALPGEKYEDRVRVVKIRDISMELCGGTHLTSTGEIGLFIITDESSISSGTRRIEALTGEGAYRNLQETRDALSGISGSLKVPLSGISSRVSELLERNKSLEKEVKGLERKTATSKEKDLLSQVSKVEDINLICARVDGAGQDTLRSLTDSLKGKIGSGIIILGTIINKRVVLIGGVTGDLTKKGWRADSLIKEVAKIVNGSGGGRADLAQAGGKNPENIDKAISSVPDIVKKQVKFRAS